MPAWVTCRQAKSTGSIARKPGRPGRGRAAGRAAGFTAKPLPVREERKTWRALLQAAEDHHASLIVPGAHGMSGDAGRALLGSVSTGLVHHSKVPVLVVPATARDEDTDGPLLLCYDGSDSAKRAIEIAGGLFDPQPALVLHFWDSWVAEAPALAALSRWDRQRGNQTRRDRRRAVLEADRRRRSTRPAIGLRRDGTIGARGRARLDGGARRRLHQRLLAIVGGIPRTHGHLRCARRRVERRRPQQPATGPRGPAEETE